MSERLPLFPLGMVLLPGSPLPLHVFEERYRVLVRTLLERPAAERRFGVVLIREGREVGEDGVRALHEVGTVARLDQVEPHEDGRFDIVTVGTERFRLDALDTGAAPYLVGDVTLLPEGETDAEAGLLGRVVSAAFGDYLSAIQRSGVAQVRPQPLPEDPSSLSFLVAGAMLADPSDRQAFLACDGPGDRLRAEARYLRREAALLDALSAVPAAELLRVPFSPN